ncbi:DNA damage-inducible transcript 4-like protein [Elysia marginata]|uniref:DNA damage-inducible transcript 4-like protein n=1 Tax=Elysia marginata TaxID=1093978 RepID=A0AAV4GW39_9GAST|nr:DNA damage-inducible transcript 4-like protein [Elysia marginata]
MNNYGSASFTPNAATTDPHLDMCLGEQHQVEASIRSACERELNCRVIFPAELLSRVAGDILRMSVAEPCGVKGCAIILCLQEKDRTCKIATVFGGSLSPPTFEIHVTLREDTRSWKTFQKVFLTIKSCLLNSNWKSSPRILHPAYQLEKRRLYRSVSSSLELSGYH